VEYIREAYQLGIGRACKIMNLQRSLYYYRSKKDDTEVINKLQELAEKHTAHGFWKLYDYLRNEGHRWNHKRVYRIYRALRMHLRRKLKKRLPKRIKQPLQQSIAINKSWSMDFMHDSLYSGRKFRTLNIIDDYNREALTIEIDTSLPSARVVRVLKNLIAWRGSPEQIRVDNGPEFLAEELVRWCNEQNIKLQYIQPGKPSQNGYAERFNRTYRTEVLDAYLFEDLDEVRELTEEWMIEYNNNRPHDALKGLSPVKYRELNELICPTFMLS
jgi:putative transposase